MREEGGEDRRKVDREGKGCEGKGGLRRVSGYGKIQL